MHVAEGDLVALDRDHPGFRDPEYRRRRNAIARIALDHRIGDPVPDVDYTEDEHGVWRLALARLEPLHRRYGLPAFLTAWDALDLPRDRTPQLREVNERLRRSTGFEMAPVAGLVAPRVFLHALADGRFLATQYMRHHSAPLYTPEPDVIHEIVGHAALLADPTLADLNRLFGRASLDAGDGTMADLIALYWYTLEFGVVREPDGLRILGAGLYSSSGELARFETHAALRTFTVEAACRTSFDPTDYQSTLFVGPGLDATLAAVREYLEHVVRGGGSSAARFHRR